MKEFFYTGGPLFMSILTILLLILCAWSVYIVLLMLRKSNGKKYSNQLDSIKSIGLFAMMVGILGQLIGMYGIYSEIQNVDDISIKIFYGGLKVSMISTIYGIIIYLLAIAIWFAIKSVLNNRN